MQLERYSLIQVKQKVEIAEFLGFETRNKYEISTPEEGVVGFAAEQQKGILGFFMRQFLGHWRSFEIQIFDKERALYLRAIHPFRFYFQRLEVFDAHGRFLGALQQRFSILTKKFDVQDNNLNQTMTVCSPFWRIWTFPFERNGREVAKIVKKWTGLLAEGFTDKDNFQLQYLDPSLSQIDRELLLAGAFFIDLQYFERKASNRN